MSKWLELSKPPYRGVVKAIRVSQTLEYNIDDWRELVAFLRYGFCGKSFRFNDSRKIKPKLKVVG